MSSWLNRVSPVALLMTLGAILLATLVAFNGYSDWIKTNGGLAGWLQALGSIYAILAVTFPVYVQKRLDLDRAKQAVITSAGMATELMSTVAERAFNPEAKFSEWWVPQWHIIDEVMASCPIHQAQSASALEAFVTIRELYGRMRGWDEADQSSWPREPDGAIQSYIGVLVMNANMQMTKLREVLG